MQRPKRLLFLATTALLLLTQTSLTLDTAKITSPEKEEEKPIPGCQNRCGYCRTDGKKSWCTECYNSKHVVIGHRYAYCEGEESPINGCLISYVEEGIHWCKMCNEGYRMLGSATKSLHCIQHTTADNIEDYYLTLSVDTTKRDAYVEEPISCKPGFKLKFIDGKNTCSEPIQAADKQVLVAGCVGYDPANPHLCLKCGQGYYRQPIRYGYSLRTTNTQYHPFYIDSTNRAVPPSDTNHMKKLFYHCVAVGESDLKGCEMITDAAGQTTHAYLGRYCRRCNYRRGYWAKSAAPLLQLGWLSSNEENLQLCWDGVTEIGQFGALVRVWAVCAFLALFGVFEW